MWFPPKPCVVLTRQVSRFTWLKMGQLQDSAGRRQTGFVSACVWQVPVFSGACSCSLCGSLRCIIVGDFADTLRWREICACEQQWEVLCLHVLWQVQVLSDACRSLPFSAWCVRFLSTGRRELRERQKEKKKKKKKQRIGPSYLTLLPAVPKWQSEGLAAAAWPCAGLLCALKS
jgi:hypothetical protein